MDEDDDLLRGLIRGEDVARDGGAADGVGPSLAVEQLERLRVGIADLGPDLGDEAAVLAVAAAVEGPREGLVRLGDAPAQVLGQLVVHAGGRDGEAGILADERVVGWLAIRAAARVAREEHAAVDARLVVLDGRVEAPAIARVAPDLIGRMESGLLLVHDEALHGAGAVGAREPVL